MRLQLQRADKDPYRQPRYTGMIHAFRTIVRQEHWYSLFKVRFSTKPLPTANSPDACCFIYIDNDYILLALLI
jgi:hypothetical protein